MLEKEKISSSQLCMMMILTVVASGVMWIPGITGKYAKNDLWLSPIWASIPGLVTVLITSRLHRLYPNQSVIQYSEEILGRLSGKAISFVILLFYLQITGMIVRNYADFIVANFLPRTPISFVIASMIIVCSFAVKGGVEVVGRSAQLFFPIFLSVVVFMPLLLSDMNLDYLFPVLENGLWPSIKASLIPSGWYVRCF